MSANTLPPVSHEAAVKEATQLVQRLTVILAAEAEHLPAVTLGQSALLNLDSYAVLGRNLTDLGKVQDGAHDSKSCDSKRVDPRLRLIDYREVDGHRQFFIDGVADSLVCDGYPVGCALDGSAVNGDTAHDSPSVGAVSDTASPTVGAAVGSGSPSSESAAPPGGRVSLIEDIEAFIASSYPRTLRAARKADFDLLVADAARRRELRNYQVIP